MPRRFPVRRYPVSSCFAQRPCRRRRSARTTCRARFSMSPKASSATDWAPGPGIRMSSRPRLRAYSRSMLSSPLPARIKSLRARPASRMSAVMLTPDRKMRISRSPMSDRSPSLLAPNAETTSCCDSRVSIAVGSMRLASRILITASQAERQVTCDFVGLEKRRPKNCDTTVTQTLHAPYQSGACASRASSSHHPVASWQHSLRGAAPMLQPAIGLNGPQKAASRVGAGGDASAAGGWQT